MKKYFVYIHKKKNKVLFVGKGTIRKNSVSHKSKYHRAYSQNGRNQFWHNEVGNSKYDVEIIYETSTEKDALNKEGILKKKYGMKRIIMGWGYEKKYIKNKGSLVNVQENEHRINKCTNKVCPYCEGRSTYKDIDDKSSINDKLFGLDSFYCRSCGILGGENEWQVHKKNATSKQIDYHNKYMLFCGIEREKQLNNEIDEIDESEFLFLFMKKHPPQP